MSFAQNGRNVNSTGIILITRSRISTAIPLVPLYAYMTRLWTKGFIMQQHNCHNLKRVPYTDIKRTQMYEHQITFDN
jgi:hypothetical protein